MVLNYILVLFISSSSLLLSSKVHGCQVKDVHSYTTTDGLVIASTAFATTFTVTCSDPSQSSSLVLFAEVDGVKRSIPVMKSVDGTTYQISWTSEELVKPSLSSSYKIYSTKVYDEEGYAQLRKAQRKADGSGSDVKPLFSLDVPHPGTYKGPYLQTELIAAFLSVFVWWSAYLAKAKLTA